VETTVIHTVRMVRMALGAKNTKIEANSTVIVMQHRIACEVDGGELAGGRWTVLNTHVRRLEVQRGLHCQSYPHSRGPEIEHGEGQVRTAAVAVGRCEMSHKVRWLSGRRICASPQRVQLHNYQS